MPDATPVLLADWLGRGLSTVVGAGVTAMTMIFVSRKNAEASLLEKVNDRIDAQFKRQDAELENLHRTVITERVECARQLATGQARIDALQARIDALMGEPVAQYSAVDLQRAGRKAARAPRPKRKPKDAP